MEAKDYALLIVAVIATIFSCVQWVRAVNKAGVEGPEPNPKGAIPSAVWISVFMIVWFLTLTIFTRDLAVWTGYAHKALGNGL